MTKKKKVRLSAEEFVRLYRQFGKNQDLAELGMAEVNNSKTGKRSTGLSVLKATK